MLFLIKIHRSCVQGVPSSHKMLLFDNMVPVPLNLACHNVGTGASVELNPSGMFGMPLLLVASPFPVPSPACAMHTRLLSSTKPPDTSALGKTARSNESSKKANVSSRLMQGGRGGGGLAGGGGSDGGGGGGGGGGESGGGEGAGTISMKST